MDREVVLSVNGRRSAVRVSPGERLLDTLRRKLYLTGTKEGCGIGECGACTVLMDGKAVNSCLVLTEAAEGHEITTIEGIGTPEQPDRVQEAFIRHNAIQCGFCTPGLVMSAEALLAENPHPTEEEVKTAIAGNLCRCTGYQQVIEAILDASGNGRTEREEEQDSPEKAGFDASEEDGR